MNVIVIFYIFPRKGEQKWHLRVQTPRMATELRHRDRIIPLQICE